MAHVRLSQPLPLGPQRLRPAPERPQHRPVNRPHIGPPESVGIWLDVACSEAREPDGKRREPDLATRRVDSSAIERCLGGK